MATVTITYDNATEAAIGASCLAKFGAGVYDELVTNWLKGHADNFKREKIETLMKAAVIDSKVNDAIEVLSADANKALAAANSGDAAIVP